jgi:hypothetical protein
MPSVLIGRHTGQSVSIGDVERRSGFYILGKPGMGKSALMVNMICQDYENGQRIFFLDPHGDAISEIIKRLPGKADDDDEDKPVLLFDPQDEKQSFGINLLDCDNVNSLTEVTNTYTRAYNVFLKLWEESWGVWLQLILQNVLWAFIEHGEYTLAEVPLFLNPRNTAFRKEILNKVKLNPACRDFWQYEFFERRERDQQERVDAALTRINTLLTHPYVRHIIGQPTTISFSQFVTIEFPHTLLFRLSANLPEDIKKFIGTILMSELLHAIRNRPEGERDQVAIYVDEFQNFSSSDDLRDLITQGRKFGSAITFAHQERFGQFADNQKIMGATLASANMVVFQPTVIDAKELAPEFAKAPTTTETHLEPELVIAPKPFFELLRKGHAHPKIAEYVKEYFWPIESLLNAKRDNMDTLALKRTASHEAASLSRDQASISQTQERVDSLARGRAVETSGANARTRLALEQSQVSHAEAQEIHQELMFWQDMQVFANERIDRINTFLVKLMMENTPLENGYEPFAQFMEDMFISISNCYEGKRTCDHHFLLYFYLYLRFGDRKAPREIYSWIAHKYYPKEMEKHYIDVGKRRINKEGWEEWLRKQYLENKVVIHIGRAALTERKWHNGGWVYDQDRPYWLPDLPARHIPEEERLRLIEWCLLDLREEDRRSYLNLLAIFDHLEELCYLLRRPENHIKIPSGQYVEKQVHVRQVHDMSDEMAQELSNLPRFNAYAKIIKEEGGQQTVWKGRIQTLPLIPQYPNNNTGVIFDFSSDLCTNREEIEQQIRERQEKWRRAQTPTSPEPPVTPKPPPTSD